MTRAALPWDEYAQDFGFSNEAELIDHIVKSKANRSDFADRIGVDPPTLYYRIHRVGHKYLQRGGDRRSAFKDAWWDKKAAAAGFRDAIHMFSYHKKGEWHKLASDLDVKYNTLLARRMVMKKRGMI